MEPHGAEVIVLVTARDDGIFGLDGVARIAKLLGPTNPAVS